MSQDPLDVVVEEARQILRPRRDRRLGGARPAADTSRRRPRASRARVPGLHADRAQARHDVVGGCPIVPGHRARTTRRSRLDVRATPSLRIFAGLACVLLLASGCRPPGLSSLRSALGLGSSQGSPRRISATISPLRRSLQGHRDRVRGPDRRVRGNRNQAQCAALEAPDRRPSPTRPPALTPARLRRDLRAATAQYEDLVMGAGADLFRRRTARRLVAASEELVEAARDIGRCFLSPAQQAKLEEQVTALAGIRSAASSYRRPCRPWSLWTAPGGSFDWAVGLPLAPFRALEGVDAGAQAIRDFNATAQRFNQVVADLPQILRWNVELFSTTPAAAGGRARRATPSRSSHGVRRASPQTAASLPRELREAGLAAAPAARGRRGRAQLDAPRHEASSAT